MSEYSSKRTHYLKFLSKKLQRALQVFCSFSPRFNLSTMTVADIFVAYYMLSLMVLSIGLGLINLQQFYRFCKVTKAAKAKRHSATRDNTVEKFIETRIPSLIITYCIIALISSLFTLPYISFAHTLYTQHNINKESSIKWLSEMSNIHKSNIIRSKWVFEFIHELSTCFLLILIAIRSWCLYYDYRCAIARIDKLWRLRINPQEKNIWLHYKPYLGNPKFLFPGIALIFSFILILFIIFHIMIQNFTLNAFMADFFVAIPICIFILFLCYKIRSTQDPHMIKKELQRLSICVSIVGFSFISWIIKHSLIDPFYRNAYNQDTVDIHILMYSVDVVFTFFTVYFQTAWVIQNAVIVDKEKEIRQLQLGHNRSNSRSRHSSRSGIRCQMVDVLRSGDGFKLFANHCEKEMNVEGLVKYIIICIVP